MDRDYVPNRHIFDWNITFICEQHLECWLHVEHIWKRLATVVGVKLLVHWPHVVSLFFYQFIISRWMLKL